ncbi:hypothetical protein CBS101457_002683 [Exobasidium rhododendri]|nr:hypothetical protein CBS101457_002683 [Exobasidium rhododendri]
MQLVRVRSKDGIFRIPLEPSDDASKLIEKFLETAPNADPDTLTLSNQPRGGEMKSESLLGNTLSDLGITHGHLLYATYQEKKAAEMSDPKSAPIPSASSSSLPPSTNGKKREKKPWEDVTEEAVDVYWESKDGKIPRQRDVKLCRHGDKAMCDYCMPLEPYDTAYQLEHSIKHLSFHSHLRKQDIATNRPSQSYIPPLQEEDYTVKTPCPSGQHAPWPAGICTKCQPSAITLTRQPYRMVDHVEFAHPQLIENLLNFWRSTGLQRFAFLLGRYEAYDKVPMGVKAVVEGMTEPAQEGDADGLTLGVPWTDAAKVEKMARFCGLSIVGMIYTDLTPLDPTFSNPESAGKVVCKRHKDSFFLSGCEVMFSSILQKSNPNPSRFSATGKYNSKFVTCVISGTEDGAIDVSAYQISEQGMAMVSADMIEASVNPNIIRVRNSEGKRYVPEVFYRYKNEYKIEVKESAKPTFPVEYLLVTATHGFPTQPTPTFLSFNFPIENRPGLHDQDLGRALSSIASVVGSTDMYPLGYEEGADVTMNVEEGIIRAREKLVGVLSDWHLLCFLDKTGILDEEDIKATCRVAVSHDATVALDQLLQRTGWQTLVAIAMEHSPQRNGSNDDAEQLEAGQPGEDTLQGTGAYAGKSSSTNNTTMASEQVAKSSTTTATSKSGNHRRSDSPILYTGDSDDEGYYASNDEGEADEDDDMFEDATSNTPHESAALSVPPQQDVARSPSPPITSFAAASAAAAASGVKACPHCTFENEASATDCDVCGLPL